MQAPIDFLREDKVVPIGKLAKFDSNFLLDLTTHLKILTPKQMLRRLTTALGQLRMGNTYENLLNEIKQVMYSLQWANDITKNVHKNIVNSIEL